MELNEIEYKISCGEINASQVFTQMKQHVKKEIKHNYFLAFDFFIDSKNINKFNHGIINVDLSKMSLPDIAKNIVINSYPELDISEVTIKITAFNNIDI